MTPQELQTLFDQHRWNERHRTVKETRYWCEQCKRLAQMVIEALAGAGAVAIAERGIMSEGHTMAVFDAGRVPPGTKIFTHPALIAVGVDEAVASVVVTEAMVDAYRRKYRENFVDGRLLTVPE